MNPPAPGDFPAAAGDPRGYSLNSATVRGAAAEEVITLAAEHGFGGVGLWRDVLDQQDLGHIRALTVARDLAVTSVCRGGMFPQPTPLLRSRRFDDNRLAIDQAAALDAACLVLVCGAPIGTDLAGARQQIRDGILALIPHAEAAGVDLAVEPFHPMLAASRSAITSLREAAELIDTIDHPRVGVAVDSYHVWWEIHLRNQIHALGDRIMSLQLADWVTPIRDELTSRGMPGDGAIDIAGFLRASSDAGYRGLIEIEVLSAAWWARPAAETVAAAARSIASLPRISPTP